MKYYVAENQKPVGPFEVSQLVARGIKGNDLVWAEGMADWTTAESIDEIREALYATPDTEKYRETAIPELPPRVEPAQPQMPPQQPRYQQPQQPSYAPGINQPDPSRIPPKSWLVESILVTLFCCLPFGIVGIIKAGEVSSLWQRGMYDAAYASSASAKKWTIIGFCIGIAQYVLGLLYYIFIFTLGALS